MKQIALFLMHIKFKNCFKFYQREQAVLVQWHLDFQMMLSKYSRKNSQDIHAGYVIREGN